MTEQKLPHTQSQQNINPDVTRLEPDEQEPQSSTDDESVIYENMAGAETGGTRSSKKTRDPAFKHVLEPATEAYEGTVNTRTPKTPVQGITAHSSQEESARQQKVVKDRPDAQAGVNHPKR